MKLKDYVLWNKRLAAVYAFGVWTMVGSYGFYYYSSKRQEGAETVVPETHLDEELIDYSSLDEKREKKNNTGWKITNTVEYKKDFVPYSTKAYNLVKSVFGTAPDPITERSREEK